MYGPSIHTGHEVGALENIYSYCLMCQMPVNPVLIAAGVRPHHAYVWLTTCLVLSTVTNDADRVQNVI